MVREDVLSATTTTTVRRTTDGARRRVSAFDLALRRRESVKTHSDASSAATRGRNRVGRGGDTRPRLANTSLHRFDTTADKRSFG